jgi:hypothetical protein
MSHVERDGHLSVARKIAEAAMNIHSYGATTSTNDRLMDALSEHLERMIGDGVRDPQVLIEEGITFLRRHETKPVR